MGALFPAHLLLFVSLPSLPPSATLAPFLPKEAFMAETKPQSLANDTRWDPFFHFFVIPIFVLGLLLSLVHFFAHITGSDLRDHIHAILLILLALAFLILAFKVRLYALKV